MLAFSIFTLNYGPAWTSGVILFASVPTICTTKAALGSFCDGKGVEFARELNLCYVILGVHGQMIKRHQWRDIEHGDTPIDMLRRGLGLFFTIFFF
jgi:hypothetical protein